MPTRRQLANAIRFLSMDAVQKAKSGHPGAPMGMADIAEVLWRDFMNHNPTNPKWADRPQVATHLGRKNPGPPGIWLCTGRGNYHRAARSRYHQCGGNGDCRENFSRPI